MHTTPDARGFTAVELAEMSVEDRFRLVHAVQFPTGIYPAGAILPMSYGPKKDWTFKARWDDVDARWAWASSRLGRPLYQVAGAQPADLGRTARGRRDTVLAVNNLWLDVDTPGVSTSPRPCRA